MMKDMNAEMPMILDGAISANAILIVHSIKVCCQKKVFQSYGYLWSFDKDYIGRKKKRKNCKTVYQYDLQGNFIQEWESLSVIQKTLGYNKNNLSHLKRK